MTITKETIKRFREYLKESPDNMSSPEEYEIMQSEEIKHLSDSETKFQMAALINGRILPSQSSQIFLTSIIIGAIRFGYLLGQESALKNQYGIKE